MVMETKLMAKRILFIGHVQGVGFRYTAQETAEREGLTGFVRNLADGTVEMLVQGRADQIDQCLEQIGLEFGGHIRERQIEQVSPDLQYTDFCIAF
jgi:acylphosphatase